MVLPPSSFQRRPDSVLIIVFAAIFEACSDLSFVMLLNRKLLMTNRRRRVATPPRFFRSLGERPP